ncbi:hypothetical protein [Cellulomonas xiejunii]|uniref:hypothetical protein n=1 Tax=Cellulomonas xiejunii TaxID=2968083 RepID=UPI001D0F209C|nr:hypothetical protein [Cellulomonas xiejunii]MCC2314728.1 hypothetical protein [Cellulomonas xiejunii]
MGAVRVVLVGGHESADGADLAPVVQQLPEAAVSTPGRSLLGQVRAALAGSDAPVVVLPMTWGRDPVMIAETARTLRWVAGGDAHGRVALSEPFGTTDHLIALLRTAATRTATRWPGSGLVVSAPRASPFDDAELHRVAHLVRVHGAGLEIGVACVGEPADLTLAVDRVRALRAGHVAVVPAGFATACPEADALADVDFVGPLMTTSAVLRVVRERTVGALHDLEHGHDGIAAGLDADHGHGYAHSHGPDGEHTHTHGDHAHTHAPHPDPHATSHASALG